MKNRKLPIITVLLLLSILNYTKIKGTENIRTIEFASIFVIGMLTSLLVVTLIEKFKNKA
ncbi:MAG: hypothetical protein KBC56_02900 [Flavobacterium sp.]|nr:hypothetical protein [Flavobacterium sp.]